MMRRGPRCKPASDHARRSREVPIPVGPYAAAAGFVVWAKYPAGGVFDPNHVTDHISSKLAARCLTVPPPWRPVRTEEQMCSRPPTKITLPRSAEQRPSQAYSSGNSARPQHHFTTSWKPSGLHFWPGSSLISSVNGPYSSVGGRLAAAACRAMRRRSVVSGAHAHGGGAQGRQQGPGPSPS